MVEAERILSAWFAEHDEHDKTYKAGGWQVKLWCEDCYEARDFKIGDLRSAVGEQLKADGAVTF